MPAIKCGSCHEKHDTVAQVRLCYERKARAQAVPVKVPERQSIYNGDYSVTEQYTRAIQRQEREDDERAYAAKASRDEALIASSVLDAMAGGTKTRAVPSDKQVSYVMDLLSKREWPDALTEDDLRAMERRQVSKLIGQLLGAPHKAQPASTGWDVGVYKTSDGRVLRVYLGQRSGRLLVSQAVDTGHKWKYVYIGAANAHHMGDAQPLPLEEAKEWGRLTGMCMICGRRLDVPESVEAGIGPVCASKER